MDKGVVQSEDERIDKGILQWFSHVENGGIAKRVYVGECAGSHSVSRLLRRYIDIMRDCLRKRGLDDRQARRMVQDKCEWRGFVRGNILGMPWEMNP